MNRKALVSQDWDDLVFENRNKEYGAYTLRKKYSVSVIEATMITLGIAVFIFLLPGIVNHFAGKKVLPPIVFENPITLLPNPKIIVPTKPQQPVRAEHHTAVRNILPAVTTEVVPDENVVETVLDHVSSDETTGNGNGNPDEGNGVAASAVAGTAVEPVETSEARTFVEFMPEFVGGLKAMNRFFSDNVEYPRSAKRIGMEGKVYVQFVIGKDGNVKDVVVVRSVSADLDREAARVIAAMPRWKPGRMGQVAVPVKMVLPIYFRLDGQ